MESKKIAKSAIIFCWMALAGMILLASVGMSIAQEDICVNCHQTTTPGIVKDWENSAHIENGVKCLDCHSARDNDSSAIMNHMGSGYNVTPVVSPNYCKECHSKEVEEFSQSLHALAGKYYELLYEKQKLPYLESQVEGGFLNTTLEGNITHSATLRGCQACHGTNMTGKTTKDFEVWPNNGIGRINPDGSLGTCAACHSRHKFSIEEARKPETCGQCHMGPDHPQIEIYMESKHGNIYASEGDEWNWTKDDWKAGVDYRAPTCASCHMSSAGDVPATHDVSSRLSWELEPEISRHTDNTANALGVNISDGSTWEEKRSRMQTVCKQCHSSTWVENYYEQADIAIELYNKQYNESKAIVNALREESYLTPEPFDEPIEFKIYEMWHHEGRRSRMGAFMMGPDYVQWHGFYEMLKDKVEILHMEKEIRGIPGDLNGDNLVNTQDVTLAAYMLIGKIQPDVISVKRADFNENGEIDIGDVAKLAYFVAKKIISLE
ncbi:MAG: multiheme c-type cytochrome [Methanosarcinales archaeon]